MKKTIVLLLSIATMIGCLAAPAAAVSFKIYNKRMSTFYYNTYMANQAKIDFKRSPALSNPEDYKTTIKANVWLTGEDGRSRGEKTLNTYICSNYCFAQSSPVDSAYKNTPNGTCKFIKQVANN